MVIWFGYPVSCLADRLLYHTGAYDIQVTSDLIVTTCGIWCM